MWEGEQGLLWRERLRVTVYVRTEVSFIPAITRRKVTFAVLHTRSRIATTHYLLLRAAAAAMAFFLPILLDTLEGGGSA